MNVVYDWNANEQKTFVHNDKSSPFTIAFNNRVRFMFSSYYTVQ